jgi:hypothetical protein
MKTQLNSHLTISEHLAEILEASSPTDLLEALVDQLGFLGITEGLAEIARLKADHYRENWQDNQTAKVFDRFANKLDKLSL